MARGIYVLVKLADVLLYLSCGGVGRERESIETEVIGDTRASCMISGQENALVNQRSKLCELAGRPQATVCATCFFVMVHDTRGHIICLCFVHPVRSISNYTDIHWNS